MITYVIERKTHGVDTYEVSFEDDDPMADEHFAIELVERGDIQLYSHEDLDWDDFRVVAVDICPDDDSEWLRLISA